MSDLIYVQYKYTQTMVLDSKITMKVSIYYKQILFFTTINKTYYHHYLLKRTGQPVHIQWTVVRQYPGHIILPSLLTACRQLGMRINYMNNVPRKEFTSTVMAETLNVCNI